MTEKQEYAPFDGKLDYRPSEQKYEMVGKLAPCPSEQEYAQFVGKLAACPSTVAERLTREISVEGGLIDDNINILHAAIGISTEAGELLDALKKRVFYGTHLDAENVIEELGDIEWYLQLARSSLGVTRERVIAVNVRKLKARYPEGFTAEKAERRDLDAERLAMSEPG